MSLYEKIKESDFGHFIRNRTLDVYGMDDILTFLFQYRTNQLFLAFLAQSIHQIEAFG